MMNITFFTDDQHLNSVTFIEFLRIINQKA